MRVFELPKERKRVTKDTPLGTLIERDDLVIRSLRTFIGPTPIEDSFAYYLEGAGLQMGWFNDPWYEEEE